MGLTRVRLDCSRYGDPDLSAIDEIARLQLACGRCGCGLRLANADRELLELIRFAGLAGVLRVESGRETEEWEQPSRVEEERELGDPPA